MLGLIHFVLSVAALSLGPGEPTTLRPSAVLNLTARHAAGGFSLPSRYADASGTWAAAQTTPDLTGLTPSNDYLTTAIRAASVRGAAELILPAGSMMIDTRVGSVVMPSNMRIRGAGRGKTTIICNDAVDQTTSCLSTAVGSSDVRLSDLTVKGLGDSGHYRSAAAPIFFQGCTDCSIDHVDVRYARFISIYAKGCDRFAANDNHVYRSMLDGIAVSDTPNAIISRNTIVGANDDAISAHSFDTTAAPVRSGVTIADNVISESQGIDALGLKIARISGNVMRRMMSYGIVVSADPYFAQGDTAVFALDISNNVITDVFARSETNPRGTPIAYMRIGGGQRQAASSGSGAPGWPDSAGAMVSPFGSGAGAYYANRTNAPGVASPGGGWINVHDNVLLRTLPATTAWAQWGYGDALYVGDNGDGTGFHRGGVPESALNMPGILIDGPMTESRIANNLVRTTGSYGVGFSPNIGGSTAGPAIADFDYDGLTIAGNKFKDVTTACVRFDTSARSNQRISLIDNTCDGDPRFVSPGRGPNGTWVTRSALFGFYAPYLASAGEMRGNTFRNVSTPLAMTSGAGGILKINNVVYAHGSVGYSTANTGVGDIPGESGAWSVVDEDGNPASATFGQMLTLPDAGATGR